MQRKSSLLIQIHKHTSNASGLLRTCLLKDYANWSPSGKQSSPPGVTSESEVFQTRHDNKCGDRCSKSKSFIIFDYTRVSPSNQSLAKVLEDSGYEIDDNNKLVKTLILCLAKTRFRSRASRGLNSFCPWEYSVFKTPQLVHMITG